MFIINSPKPNEQWQSQHGESPSGQSQHNNEQQNTLVHDRNVIRNSTMFVSFCQGYYMHVAQIMFAEMIGTFILVYSICGVLGSMHLMGHEMGLLEYATTAGSAITVITFSFGSISGAHVNPSITIALAIFGHFPWSKVPFYVSAQMAGSLLATYVGEVVYQVKPEYMITQPVEGETSSAFWAEFLASLIITILVTSLARDAKSVGKLSGLVTGVSIALAVLTTGPISGGSLNPARSLGPAFLSRKFKNIWIYMVAPTGGAVLGVLTVHILCRPPHPQAPNSLTTTNSLA